MERRTFLSAAAAFALAPMAGFAGSGVAYEPGLIETALKDGKTVFVDYSATWCGTCKRQERVIKALREENPAYNDAMLFVVVDWDDYASHAVTTSRQIPRRSTLIVLRGDEELGRIVAGTGKAEIKQLMDTGLNAGG